MLDDGIANGGKGCRGEDREELIWICPGLGASSPLLFLLPKPMSPLSEMVFGPTSPLSEMVFVPMGLGGA